MPTRVLLADDHGLVRQGFRALLATLPDVEVVGEAANGREALRLIRALAPEVVLMDIAMPELNGLDATEAYVIEALRAGAVGYLLKDADAGDLERAIRAVAHGERYLAPAVSHHVIERYLRAEPGGATETLSPRQREVLQLIAEGRSTREMAERLNLSVKTIETHRAQLMQRLEIFDVAGLTRYALRIGLIDAAR